MTFFSHALLLASLLFVCGCGSNPSEAPSTEQPSQPSNAQAGSESSSIERPSGEPNGKVASASDAGSNQDPPIEVKAEEFFASFKADAQAFAKKYAGKSVVIEGTITKFTEELPGETLVLLKADDLLGIMCRLVGEPQPWAMAVMRQNVTIHGRCPAAEYLASQPSLEQCKIVATGPGPQTKSASDLAREFALDREAAWGQLQNQTIVVEGKVRAIEDRGSAKVVVLEGTPDADIECWFNSGTKQQVANLKPGDKAKVVGELAASTDESDRNFPLSTCLLITQPSALDN